MTFITFSLIRLIAAAAVKKKRELLFVCFEVWTHISMQHRTYIRWAIVRSIFFTPTSLNDGVCLMLVVYYASYTPYTAKL